QRLAQDVGEEARRGEIGLAGADDDGGQPDADAIHEALARVVVEEQLADRLLRAVAGERRRKELVADGLGERRPEYRDRRGEDEPGNVGTVAQPLLPDRLEQQPGAVE